MIAMKNLYSLSFVLTMLLSLSACVEDKNDNIASSAEPKLEATSESAVLATVYGEPITENDVDFMIARTFSAVDQFQGAEQLRRKVLESLIASRAMAFTIKQEADADMLDTIDAKVAAYREELYVKEYLSQHATPEPVSTKMMQDYYNNNPTLFGAELIKVFELLSLPKDSGESAKNNFIQAASDLSALENWQEYASQHSLAYKKSTFSKGLLAPALEGTLKQLGQGETSDIVIVSGTPMLLRVISVEEIPAKPIAEVGTDIRRRLAPIQLKKAIKAVTENVIQKAEIVVTNNN